MRLGLTPKTPLASLVLIQIRVLLLCIYFFG